MKNRTLISILAIILLLGCGSNSKNLESDKEKNDVSALENDCPLLSFSESFGEGYSVIAQYYECEADWKSKLKVLKGRKIIYVADSLLEFEFNSSLWPKLKRIGPNNVQLLLEVNDRPLKSKIVLLTIADDSLIDEEIIPYFESPPKDVDEDKNLEYIGQLDFVEAFHPDSTNYNPILFFEDRSTGIILDSQTTIKINSQLWGDFYGFEMRQDITLIKPRELAKYLEKN